MQKIVCEFDGQEYTLAYNRASVMEMENRGFRVNELEDGKQFTMLTLLFEGAFIMHHKGLSRKTMDAIWDACDGKEDFIVKLIEMYTDTVTDFLSTKEGVEKKASWKMA